jgi:hypothetical protein
MVFTLTQYSALSTSLPYHNASSTHAILRNMRQGQHLSIGIYEHYRSTQTRRRYYQLLGLARHTETEEILAIYIPLYIDKNTKGPRLQARPLNMFLGNVTIDGKSKPRFRFVGSELQ